MSGTDTGRGTIRRVVIAGGGTAGWIAAAALARNLGPLLEIVLVESEEIGTIGVGEATIPTAVTFHKLAGIDEQAFMRATGATFKLGIAFENWARPGDRYLHSFGRMGHTTWMGDFQHFWLEARAQGVALPIGAYSLETQAAEQGRFALGDGGVDGYAYHLDAGRYATFLRDLAEREGVERIAGTIGTVERDSGSGDIAALLLADGRRIAGDLFIDCTGFRALLIGAALGVGFEDWSRWLPTDSALAVQTRSVQPPLPYTRAVAHEAGWQWRIPLQHRVGNGIVFASAFMDERAGRERLLGSIDGEPLGEPRLIRYRTGRREAVWARNCVALGLSSGFVEPLESTSIHLIMAGVTRLVQAFPFDGISEAAVRRYNDEARAELEGIRDFVVLHYKATERGDTPFWRHCRDMPVPDTLAARIALFREGAHAFQRGEDLFRVDSWVQVLLGQRIEPEAWHRLARLLRPGQLDRVLADRAKTIAAAVARMPTHQQFIDRYCAASDVSAAVTAPAPVRI